MVDVGSADARLDGYYCFICGESGDYRGCDEGDQLFMPNDVDEDDEDGYGEDEKCRECWQRKFDSD